MGRSGRWLWLIPAFMAVLPMAPAVARQEIGDFPREGAWWRLTPSVIWEGETFTLEIHLVGGEDVARVGVYNLVSPETTDPIREPGVGDFLSHYSAVLFDDGTRGDRVAGDRVFTREGLTPAVIAWQGEDQRTGTFYGNIRVQFDDGRYAANSESIRGGVVRGAYRDAFAVEHFGNGLSATAYAFFIEDGALEVIDGYPIGSVVCGKENFEAYRKLYSVFPDVFDFATVMPGMQILRPDGLGENVPYAVTAGNAVEHIGGRVFDNTAAFGSSGRLKATIYHSFGDIAIMDHEIAHAWGADIGSAFGLVDGSHWNEYTDIAGQLSAFHLTAEGQYGLFVYNGDETWRFVSNRDAGAREYAPLELYLMGLLPPEEVPPVHILDNPDLSDLERVTVESYRTVTIDDLVASEGGTRSPAYPDAQTDFTMAFIVTQDQPFGDAAYAFFSLLAADLTASEGFTDDRYFAPFQAITGGRATLDTRLPVDLPVPDLAVTTTTTTIAVPPDTVPPTVSSTTTAAAAPSTTSPEPVPSPRDDGGSGMPLIVLVAVGALATFGGLWFVIRKRR